MRSAIVAIVVLSLHSHPASAVEELFLFGGPRHKEFLGCLNCNEFSLNSVWNDFSIYGWRNEVGKWSPLGPFAGLSGPYSACNMLANDPPVIVDRQGTLYGRVTINELMSGSVCGYLSNTDRLCRALDAMCSGR
jgi:hypothetical protein